MADAPVGIRALHAAEVERLLPGLSELLVDAVAGGAGVNFMAGFTLPEAEAYWRKQIAGLAARDRIWLVAEADGRVIGTVMCIFAQQPNQPYRADVSKMLVHSSARRRGIGAALLAAVDEQALRHGRTLLVLDTEQGSDADRLYRRAGWIPAGTIPEYAYQPTGKPVGATFFYKMLAPTPPYQRPSPA